MIHELLQAISKKDYVSAKGLLEAAFKEKMADALEERRFEIIDEMFNSGLDEAKKPDRFHIVNLDGKPANLTSYGTLSSAMKDRDEKHPTAKIHQVGARGSVKHVFEPKSVKEDTADEEIVEGVSSSSKQNYEYANGHKPKGSGRWMFSTIEPRKHDVRNDEHMKHTFTSDFATFGDASKAAVKHFKSKGHVGDIHVLS